jgi:hypothetical protein
MKWKESKMKPLVLIAASVAALASGQAHAQPTTIKFAMTVSPGASTCLPNAAGTVYDHSFGEFENLEVIVKRLPPNTRFDLFSIEVPNAPFGLAWYIGDISTDSNGVGVGNFVGRFNIETFVISPGIPTTPPPNVFSSPPAVVPEATVGIRPIPCSSITSGFGSIRRATPRMQAAPVPPPRSTVNIMPASRS